MTGRMFRSCLLVAWICVFLIQSVESQTDACPSPRGGVNCEGCLNPDLDLGTGCTTCVEQGDIECTPGEQGCGVGDFTFSALFHSYSNPEEMCGECGANGETVTCQMANSGVAGSCRLRFLYCLQPYGSPPVNVTFPLPQAPFNLVGPSNTRTFMEDFITQDGGSNSASPPTVNNWNRSNPFTRELQTWPGQVQFYVVTYHVTSAGREYVYVDRVPIYLQLNLSTEFTERRTYSGIHNISQVDMSFKLSGQCAENYYGPQCAIFCSEVAGVSTCDSDGNIVCVDPEDDPQNNCETCVLPRDPEDCTACNNTDLDLSTGCTTCVEQGPIECTPGEQGCGVGDFTFSARFHYYSNPEEMCGECGANGESVTCLEANGGGKRTSCRFRFLYCLQPYGSPPVNVTFPLPQSPLTPPGSGTHNFMKEFITQEGGLNSALTVNNWNRSNPFTRELQTWPGQVQFYVVTYHFTSNPVGNEYVYVDRVPIDLQLNLSTEFTERRTYSGIHNISQFNMSFRLSGQCAENYYGPRCAIFCSEVEGVSTCDSDGSIVCVNPEGDPQNNCEPPGGGSAGLIGGVVGGILGVVIVAILVVLVLVLVLFLVRRRQQEPKYSTADTSNNTTAAGDNPMYGTKNNGAEPRSDEYASVQPLEYAAVGPRDLTATDSSAVPATGIYSEIEEGVQSPHTYQVLETQVVPEEERNFDNPIYGADSTEPASSTYAEALNPPVPSTAAKYSKVTTPGYDTTFATGAGGPGKERGGTLEGGKGAAEQGVYSELKNTHTYSVLEKQ